MNNLQTSAAKSLHDSWLTSKLLAQAEPAFTEAAIRNLIFLAESRKTSKGAIQGNGLDVALVRIGRKVLIDEAKFFNWIDAQQVAA